MLAVSLVRRGDEQWHWKSLGGASIESRTELAQRLVALSDEEEFRDCV